MGRYRLKLAYQGTAFNGWQSQPDHSGVQNVVEKALATFLRHPVRVTGASRTDTGVHAEGQIACFDTDVSFDERRWMRALHGLMPDTIGVRALESVHPEFHPIFASIGKAYRYRVWVGEGRMPQLAPFVWEGHAKLDVGAMRSASLVLLGRHDFSSFCASDSGAKTRERTIFEIAIVESGPLLDFWVIGDGFLKQMVRSIVGSLVDVGRGRVSPKAFSHVLAAQDRNRAGVTAPARGLSLVEVFYERILRVAELRSAAAAGFSLQTH